MHQGSAADWYNAKRLNQKTYAYKVLISEDYDKIIGAHLIGPHAEESINLFAMAMKAGMKASAVKNMLYAYPSLGYDIQYML